MRMKKKSYKEPPVDSMIGKREKKKKPTKRWISFKAFSTPIFPSRDDDGKKTQAHTSPSPPIPLKINKKRTLLRGGWVGG